MEPNPDAPVLESASLWIDAPPATVREILAELEAWPQWNPAIASVNVDGEVAKGTTFRWRSGATRITSTLREVDPPRRIAWTGATLGISAFHVWQLDADEAGTLVRTEESF